MPRWILYSNLHVIPVAAGFTLGTYALAGAPVDPAYIVLASCGTFLVYQWDRASGLSPEDDVNVPERRDWLLRHRVYLVLSTFLAVIAALWAVSMSSAFVRWTAVALGLVGMMYAVPFPVGRRPKEIPGLKNVLIALCWVAGGVVVPLLEADAAPAIVGWLVIHRLLYIAPDLAAADLVDRRGDRAAGLQDADEPSRFDRPRRVAIWSVAAAVCLAVAVIGADRASSGPAEWVLPAVDLIGLTGAACTVWSVSILEYRHVVVLDLWVAFPAVTWIVASL